MSARPVRVLLGPVETSGTEGKHQHLFIRMANAKPIGFFMKHMPELSRAWVSITESPHAYEQYCIKNGPAVIDRAVADPEGGPWGPLTPPFEVNFKRLNDTS